MENHQTSRKFSPADRRPDPGVATGLFALNGGAISLFADAVLGNRMVLGVDQQGDIVFAIFMDPNASTRLHADRRLIAALWSPTR
jgi:hypothetical protein